MVYMTTKFAPVSVVFPGLNEENKLANCLRAILNQKVKPKQVIFVNNNSTDETLKIANSFKTKFKKQKIDYLVITETKKGVANARNAGWSIASQPIIASTDSDCKPSKNWIKSIDKFFKENDAIAVTGKIVYYDSPPLLKKFTQNGGYAIFYKLMHFRYRFHPMPTGNSAVKKSAYLEVGGFDPSIVSINGLDDIDLASKISFIGEVKYDENMFVSTSFRRYHGFNKMIASFLERYIALKKIRKEHIKKKRKRFLAKIFDKS